MGTTNHTMYTVSVSGIWNGSTSVGFGGAGTAPHQRSSDQTRGRKTRQAEWS